MIKLKDLLNERIPKLPRINMGFGEAQDYSKMMIKNLKWFLNLRELVIWVKQRKL